MAPRRAYRHPARGERALRHHPGLGRHRRTRPPPPASPPSRASASRASSRTSPSSRPIPARRTAASRRSRREAIMRPGGLRRRLLSELQRLAGAAPSSSPTCPPATPSISSCGARRSSPSSRASTRARSASARSRTSTAADIAISAPDGPEARRHRRTTWPRHRRVEADGRVIRNWHLDRADGPDGGQVSLQASTFPDYAALGDAFAAAALPKAEPTPTIRALAARLTQGETDPEDKARLLYQYVADDHPLCRAPARPGPRRAARRRIPCSAPDTAIARTTSPCSPHCSRRKASPPSPP